MLKILIILLAAIMLNACGRFGSRAEKDTERTIMCGSYADHRPLNDDETELFRQVIAEVHGVKYTPESVATQVVAGMNYHFICKAVTATQEAQTYQAEVTIYKPLPGQGDARITNIKKL